MTELAENGAVHLDLRSQEYLDNPYPTYDYLRTHDPVHWSEPPNGFWFLTRYDDVVSMATDSRLSSSRAGVPISGLPEKEKSELRSFTDVISKFLIERDPPDHTRLKGLLQQAFTPARVERLRPRIQEVVTRMLDEVEGRGEMDVIADLATPMPGTIIAELIGLPIEDQSRFKKWSDGIGVGLTAPNIPRVERYRIGQQSMLELRGYLTAVVRSRRNEPKDDLLSALIAAEHEDGKLTEDELLTNTVFLVYSANQTTTDLIGNGILTLLRNPGQKEKLFNDPLLIVPTVEEMLRYEGPTARLMRVAKEDLEIRDKTIRKGEVVAFSFAAANRDPSKFENPHMADIERSPNKHLAFGHGPHHCLGSALARLEGQIAIGEIVRRMPNLRLVDKKPKWRSSLTFHGMDSLPVTF